LAFSSKKARTLIRERRIYPWSKGSHAAVFPIGAALVHVPLLCFIVGALTSATDTAATSAEEIQRAHIEDFELRRT